MSLTHTTYSNITFDPMVIGALCLHSRINHTSNDLIMINHKSIETAPTKQTKHKTKHKTKQQKGNKQHKSKKHIYQSYSNEQANYP